MSPLVVVLGSANLDCTLTVPSLPGPGETLLATESERHVGGKGLNKATASRRAGCPTAFIGAVGLDQEGQELALAGSKQKTYYRPTPLRGRVKRARDDLGRFCGGAM